MIVSELREKFADLPDATEVIFVDAFTEGVAAYAGDDVQVMIKFTHDEHMSYDKSEDALRITLKNNGYFNDDEIEDIIENSYQEKVVLIWS